jgi:PAS domain S-box-containing protein
MKKTDQQSDSMRVRAKAESVLKTKKKKRIPPRSEAETAKLVHELEVNKLELELQNEELRLAKEQSEAAAMKYAELYDYAPSGYFTLSKQGIIVELNLRGADMLAQERAREKKRKFSSFVSRETKSTFNLFLEKIFTSKPLKNCEVILSVDGRNPMVVHMKGIAASNGTHCLLTAVDITERKNAEELLRVTEEKYQSIVEVTSDWIWEIDAEGKYCYCSDKVEQILGYTVAEMLGKSPFDVMPPDEQKRVGAIFEKIVQNKKTIIDLENWNVHKNGHLVCLLTNGFPLFDKSGNITGYRGVDKDITDRKKEETKIRQLSQAVEQSPAYVIITDVQGNIQYVNPKFSEVTGYSPDEVIGKTPRIFKSGETPAEEYKKLWNILTTGGIWHGEFHNKKKNGELFWESATISAIKNEQGITTNYLAVKEDITAQKHLQQRFALKSSLINSLFDSVPDLVFYKDLAGVYQGCNRSFAEYAGRSEEEIVGKTDYDIFDKETADSFRNRDRHMLKLLAPQQNEEWITCPDGRKKLVDTLKTPYWDENKKLIGVIGISRDITERRKTENQLRLSEERFRSIVEKMISVQTEKDITSIIAEGTRSLVTYDTLSIYVADHSAKKLYPINIDGPQWNATNLEDWTISIGDGIIGSIIASGKSELINDAHTDIRSVYPKGATMQKEQMIVHPLRAGNIVWGAFAINRMSEQKFTAEEFELTNFIATYASLAIDNISLIDRLRSTSSRLEKLIQNIQAGVLVEDETRHITLINKNFCTMFGIPVEPEHLIGADCSESAEQSKHMFAEPENFTRRIESILRDRTIVTDEELTLIDGRTFERDYIPIFIDAEYKGHLWLYNDITLRKQNEIEIEKLARFPNENPNPVFRVSNDYTILYLNAAGKKMLDEVGAKYYDAVPSGWRPIIERAFLTNTPTEFEIAAELGTPIYATHFVPVLSAGYVNIYSSDITERKLAEWETTKAKRLAEESMRAKQDFLAKMSHELRTPMNAVLGLTNLIFNTPLSNEQLSLIQGIKSSGDNLLAIINEILNLAKIEAGKMVIDQKDFVITDTLENIRTAMIPLAEQKGIKLIFDIDPQIPEVMIGDSVRLSQIIINLLSNAIKFTDHGHVAFMLRVDSPQEKSGTVRFTVADTGIGIPQEKQQSIFEAFSQASQDISVRYGGTGLGLTIVKQLVQLMKGEIRVESVLGEGSTFTVTLPFRVSPQKKESLIQRSSGQPTFNKLEGKVLLVEDNPANQMVAVKTLQMWAVDVDVASDGYQALSKLKESAYDLVLMDIQMPGIDGFETTRRIRTEFGGTKSSIPIIAMTASVLYDPEARAINAGMNGYVSKPFELDDLYNKIAPYLSVRSASVEIVEAGGYKKIYKHLDTRFLESIASDNPAFISEMILLFEKNTPAYLKTIKKALEENDIPLLMRTAHTMKPTGGYIGINELKPLVAELEAVAEQNGTVREIRLCIQKLEVLCEEIFYDITEWKKTQQ